MSAYDKVMLARSKGRPTGTAYIEHIFDSFVELHGDRRFGDDPAIIGGIALLDGMPVTVIGHQGACAAKLWHAQPRRLPQGTAADEAGGKVPPSSSLPGGHFRGLLRPGR